MRGETPEQRVLRPPRYPVLPLGTRTGAGRRRRRKHSGVFIKVRAGAQRASSTSSLCMYEFSQWRRSRAANIRARSRKAASSASAKLRGDRRVAGPAQVPPGEPRLWADGETRLPRFQAPRPPQPVLPVLELEALLLHGLRRGSLSPSLFLRAGLSVHIRSSRSTETESDALVRPQRMAWHTPRTQRSLFKGRIRFCFDSFRVSRGLSQNLFVSLYLTDSPSTPISPHP